MKPDVIQPGYDEAGLPSQVDAWLQQAAAPAALLDPATADRHAVTSVGYNARGQRISISYGNGTSSTYAYDPQTFRLAQLTTIRPGPFAAAQRSVQELAYYFDPAGNITSITDNADTQDVIFFRNQRVEPSAGYTYDPLYRLIAATGREHLGQTGGALSPPAQIANDDSFRMSLPQPGDGNAMGTYTETYSYDPLGNILAMAHRVGAQGWTRRYSYAEASQIIVTETGNRLTATSLPGDPAAGPFTGTYSYDAHGNMTLMPHLATLTWDEDDRLRSTARQAASGGGTPQTACYAYNASGQRVRKVTDQQAASGQAATRKTERIYLGAVEIYREYSGDGTTIILERETLDLSDGRTTAALVETRTAGTDKAAAQLVRYQHSNHLGSAVLELDDGSDIISYEEYFPYGSTSYQAVRSQTETPKRYRYTGKEHDEENDLNYHGARYYAPWLARWTQPDPAGLGDGINLYRYVSGNPVALRDPSGTNGEDWSDLRSFLEDLGKSEIVQSLLTDTRPPIAPAATPMTKKPARAYANKQAADYRQSEGMVGADVQAGHTAAARHAPESGISKADWDQQPMQQLPSRRGRGLDVTITDQSGQVSQRTIHNAQEGMIDTSTGRSRAANAGKLTPRGQLDAAEEVNWRTQNVPMDQRNINTLRSSGPAARSASDPAAKPAATPSEPNEGVTGISGVERLADTAITVAFTAAVTFITEGRAPKPIEIVTALVPAVGVAQAKDHNDTVVPIMLWLGRTIIADAATTLGEAAAPFLLPVAAAAGIYALPQASARGMAGHFLGAKGGYPALVCYYPGLHKCN
jgi:RHS repeat-associated protein